MELVLDDIRVVYRRHGTETHAVRGLYEWMASRLRRTLERWRPSGASS
jgi:hypothetical protein